MPGCTVIAVKVCLLGAVTCNQSQCLHMHVTKSWHAFGEHLNAKNAPKKGHGHLLTNSQSIRVHLGP